jgi:signal peptidase I
MRRDRLVFRLLVVLGAVAFSVAAYVMWIVRDAAGGAVFRNASVAMDSTLLAGDRFTVESYPDARVAQARARHGAIVAHTYPPDSTKSFVKRLVGLPGDTLAMVAGVLHRNGRVVDEPYAWHAEPVTD